MPNKGNEERTNGSKAQCIAQANEVAIPNPSQFNFTFIQKQRYDICNIVASFNKAF